MLMVPSNSRGRRAGAEKAGVREPRRAQNSHYSGGRERRWWTMMAVREATSTAVPAIMRRSQSSSHG